MEILYKRQRMTMMGMRIVMRGMRDWDFVECTYHALTKRVNVHGNTQGFVDAISLQEVSFKKPDCVICCLHVETFDIAVTDPRIGLKLDLVWRIFPRAVMQARRGCSRPDVRRRAQLGSRSSIIVACGRHRA